ncbi:polyamine ABC transporter substrate-binding protein [Piscinibacter sakaiensis]|uniref:polyamine ABC transporter substrate-binding protein n=1 Tax=Piscinibacter sakaiensis TaxID=1547922 RepID=UPI003AACD82C
MKTRFRNNMFASVVALFAASSASLSAVPASAAEPKVLNIYNWSDYIADDTIANFEKETGIKVRYDNFDNNEILHAKLVAGKSGYDIVVPTVYWAKVQAEGGLLQKLDKSKIPNLKNLQPSVQAQVAKLDPGNQHAVVWLWGYTTVGINVDKVKAALGNMPMPENAWDLIFKPEYVSKLKSCGVSVLDSATEVIPAALRYLGKPGFSKNVADYKEVGPLLKSIRPHVTLFSSSGYINDMANGSICVALGWSGDMSIARQRAIDGKTGQKIEVLVPKTGAVLIFDVMVIPKDAPHPENAHKFINYILRPEVHASLTNKVFYANPNKESRKFVKKEIADNPTVFLSDEDMARMEAPDSMTNDVRRAMTRAFTTFKSGL